VNITGLVLAFPAGLISGILGQRAGAPIWLNAIVGMCAAEAVLGLSHLLGTAVMLMPGDNILNSGGSWGLKYPLIYGRINDQYVVWCRHCGIVFHALPIHLGMDETDASRRCRELNGLWNDGIDPAVLAAIDETP
jgi:hypothetical protein